MGRLQVWGRFSVQYRNRCAVVPGVRRIACLGVVCLSFNSGQVLSASCLELTEQIQERMHNLTSYRVHSRMVVAGQTSVARIEGVVPNRLRIELEFPEAEPPQRVLRVFDETHQWTQITTGVETVVYKLRLAGTTEPDQPFDTGFYLTGHGLLTGRDFPSTISELLNLYPLSGHCETAGTHRAALDANALRHFIASRLHVDDSTAVQSRFEKAFPYATLDLEVDQPLLVGYGLGTQDEDAVRVWYEQVELNPKIDPAVFTVNPADFSVVDLSEQYKLKDE